MEKEYNIIVNNDRTIEGLDEVYGAINENNATILRFNLPEKIADININDFIKYIEFREVNNNKTINELCEFFDKLKDDNTYSISRAITKHKKWKAQIVLKKKISETDYTIWKSEEFELNFFDSINATDEINPEIVLDIFTDLIENVNKQKEMIEKLENDKVDKENGKMLSSNDFTDDYKNKLNNIEERSREK